MQLNNLYNRAISELAKAGIESAKIDAQVLIENVLAKDRSFTYTHPSFLITNSQYAKFRRLVRRRKAGEPLAYILGYKEFYGLDFIVNKNVLVPRPETEWLVEQGIDFIKLTVKKSREVRGDLNILDIGTGSGNIIISLAKETSRQLNCFATDISPKALAVAKKNFRKLNQQKIAFYRSDLFSNRLLKNKKFNLIIANLPYVPHFKPKKNNSISYEPQDAIFAKDNGTSIIKKFLREAREHTCDGSLILLELDCRNAKALFDYSKNYYPNAEISLQKDLANLDRYLKIEI